MSAGYYLGLILHTLYNLYALHHFVKKSHCVLSSPMLGIYFDLLLKYAFPIRLLRDTILV